jgi:Fanconi anemia group D2 protein
MLLEKLPEHFDLNSEHSGASLSLVDDVARLIVNQFRWLDFIVDHNAFAEKLMQVLSICPPNLKKEIIGSLPEIIGDQNNKTVVDCLEQMLREDSAIVVPVLDSLSNLNLDEQLQEQVLFIIVLIEILLLRNFVGNKCSSSLNHILMLFRFLRQLVT